MIAINVRHSAVVVATAAVTMAVAANKMTGGTAGTGGT